MSKDLLFNPRTYDPAHFDPETRRLLRATIDWFEARGKKALISSTSTASGTRTSSSSSPRRASSRRC